MKVHIWLDNRFQVVTLVDLAGIPLKENVYLDVQEINRSAAKHMQTILNGGKGSQSKIFKEIDKVINGGNAKITILTSGTEIEVVGGMQPLIKNKK